MNGNQQPIYILKEGTERESGKGAIYNNILAACTISDAVKSTLGPKGMDKMLVDSSGDIVITNDGATILKEIDVDHPAAKMIVEVAKSQDEACGDGTTTVVIITGELLKQAKDLLGKKIHSSTINKGYSIACKEAINHLNEISIPIDSIDVNILKEIATTSMASKNANIEKNLLSSIIVKAVTKILDKKEKSYSFDVNDIQIIKVNNGSIQDTSTIDGVVVDKEVISDDLPTKVNKAKILLLNDSIEMKKTEIESKIEIRDPGQLQTFLDEEDRMIKEMVEKIHESGANVVFCQKGIDDLAINYLVEHKIFASRRVNKSDMEKVSKATGARIISSLDNISKDYLGYSDNVEIKKIGDTKMIYVTGCKNPKAVSIIIRGSTKHITDELERALHDSLSVVRVAIEDGYIITGGGSSFISTSMYLKKFAPTIGGREQMAIEAFAKALEIIPKVLAENAGLDPIDLLLDLKNKHSKGAMNQSIGIDINSGVTGDMMHLKVIEPLKVQTHAIESATETAIMILRIDDVIASKSRPPVSNSQPNPQNYM